MAFSLAAKGLQTPSRENQLGIRWISQAGSGGRSRQAICERRENALGPAAGGPKETQARFFREIEQKKET